MNEIVIYICIALLVISVILMIVSCKEVVPEDIDYAFYTLPFYKIGRLIYKKIFEERDGQGAYYQKLYDSIHTLNPAGKTSDELASFFIKKIGLSLLIIFVGLLFVLAFDYTGKKEYLLVDGKVERPDPGSRNNRILATIDIDGEEPIENYELEIASRQYTKEQLDTMLPEFITALERDFLGKNKSVDFINSDVCISQSIEGYPFSVNYKWDNKEVINRRGELMEDIPDEGVIVSFDATITYLDYSWIHTFSVHVFPKELTRSEYIRDRIEEAINVKDIDTATKEYMELPSDIDGVTVVWTEEKEEHLFILVILIIASSIGIFAGQDKDLGKRVEERDEQMLEDYTEIVSKLTLLIGAGMTVRGAFRKVALDYKAKKDTGGPIRYAYEEMLFTIHEMDSGVEETVCYSHFSSRARVQKYVKLVSLLDQNLKLGVGTMLITLREETRDAFEDRKNLIEKKSEEAGTKLLVPMILMLVVVVVVIMVPAFMSM